MNRKKEFILWFILFILGIILFILTVPKFTRKSLKYIEGRVLNVEGQTIQVLIGEVNGDPIIIDVKKPISSDYKENDKVLINNQKQIVVNKYPLYIRVCRVLIMTAMFLVCSFYVASIYEHKKKKKTVFAVLFLWGLLCSIVSSIMIEKFF